MADLHAIAAQLGLDYTFFPLFVMVAALYFVLSAVYLKPFQRLLHDRKQKTEGAKKQAHELMTQAMLRFEEYQTKLHEVHQKAQKILDESEEAAKKEEAKLLNEASLKAKASLQSTQKQLQEEQKIVLKTLSSEIPAIASEIATKVLGRPVSNA